MRGVKRAFRDEWHRAKSDFKDGVVVFVWSVPFPAAAGFAVGWIARGLMYGVIGGAVVGVVAYLIWAFFKTAWPWDLL